LDWGFDGCDGYWVGYIIEVVYIGEGCGQGRVSASILILIYLAM
jgi:hypothetical protein